MNIIVFEWFISLDWLGNNCYYMIVVFLNLNKINIDFYIYNIIKLIYD